MTSNGQTVNYLYDETGIRLFKTVGSGDEFYYSYDLKIDYDTLSPAEYAAFSELEKVSSRFSHFNEDLKKTSGCLFQ